MTLSSYAMILLQQRPNTKFFSTETTTTGDKIVSPSSFEEAPKRTLLSKGIPRSSSHPFDIPNINQKRNNDRYLLAVRVLTSYFKNFLAPHVPVELEGHFNKLLTTLGLYLQKSPLTFCDTVSTHSN